MLDEKEMTEHTEQARGGGGGDAKDASGHCHKQFVHVSLTDPHPQTQSTIWAPGAQTSGQCCCCISLDPFSALPAAVKLPRISSPALSLSCPP